MSASDFSEYFNSQARLSAEKESGFESLSIEDARDQAREAIGTTIGGALLHQGISGLKPILGQALKTVATKAGVSEEAQQAAAGVVSNLAKGNVSEAINSARAGQIAAQASNVEGQAVSAAAPQLEEVTMGISDIVKDPSLFRQYIRQSADQFGEMAQGSDEAIEVSRQALLDRGAGELPNVEETFMRAVPDASQIGEDTSAGSRVLAEATQARGAAQAAAQAGEGEAAAAGEAATGEATAAASTAATTAATAGEAAAGGAAAAATAGEAAAAGASAGVPILGPLIALGIGLAAILGSESKRHEQTDSPLITSGVQFGL